MVAGCCRVAWIASSPHQSYGLPCSLVEDVWKPACRSSIFDPSLLLERSCGSRAAWIEGPTLDVTLVIDRSEPEI